MPNEIKTLIEVLKEVLSSEEVHKRTTRPCKTRGLGDGLFVEIREDEGIFIPTGISAGYENKELYDLVCSLEDNVVDPTILRKDISGTSQYHTFTQSTYSPLTDYWMDRVESLYELVSYMEHPYVNNMPNRVWFEKDCVFMTDSHLAFFSEDSSWCAEEAFSVPLFNTFFK